MPHKIGKRSDPIRLLRVSEAIFTSAIDWSHNYLKTPEQSFSVQKLLEQTVKYHYMFCLKKTK